MSIGIEKINLYAGNLVLNIEQLTKARNRDLNYLKNDLMIDEKAVLTDYEDAVTMAVNSAKPFITDEDRDKIELCIFATESGTDFCKANSTYVCKYLGLKPQVRNYEVKNACYAATIAVQSAVNWIKSGLGKGKKALIVSSDTIYNGNQRIGEEVPAPASVAMIISENPQIVEFETGKAGYYGFECMDYARPTTTYDVINSQESLFAYLECLEGAFEHYKSVVNEDIDIKTYFKRIVYHTPFGGLVKVGHKNLLKSQYPEMKKREINENFEKMVSKSLYLSRFIGNTYSSNLYVALLSLIMEDENLNAGDRIGLYSYGSGSCAEFYSVILLPEAKKYIDSLKIKEAMKERYELSIEDFDYLTHIRDSYADKPTFQTDFSKPKGWFDKHYKGKGLLIFKGREDFRRNYEWS